MNTSRLYQLFKKNRTLSIVYFVMLFTSVWSDLSIYVIVLFGVLIMLLVPFKKYVDKMAILLFLFSFFYCLPLLFGGVGSWFNFVSYLFCPFVFYVYGNYVVDKLRYSQDLVLFLSVSMFVFPFVLYVSAIQDIVQNGFVNVHREFPIWGREIDSVLSATLSGLIVSLGLAGLPCFFVRPLSSTSGIKYFFLSLSFLSLMVVLHLINRTGIVIECVCLFVVSLYVSKKNIGRLLTIVVTILMLMIIAIKLQLISPEVFDAYSYRNEESGDGGRRDKWLLGLQYVIKYPLGWITEGTQSGYVHNLWLDIARVSGIFPFILFLMATWLSYCKFFKLWRLNNMTIFPLLLGMNICFLLSSMVEPVIEAVPLYFYLYIMMWGIQNRILYSFGRNA